MVVRKNIAKLNDNNCKNICSYLSQGLSITDAFCAETRRNRHNPDKIKAYEYRNDKWYWLFKLLDSEQNMVQYTQSC